MALQVDFSLTYSGNKIYLSTSFCQTLLQEHILAIPDPDVPTGLSPLLIPPSSAGPANAQQRAIRIQVLLSMVQDCISKEEAGELLYQRVHFLTSTQELRHSTRNFLKLARDCLREESPICLSMGLWPRHIDRFERQYNKAFAKGSSFWGGLNGLDPETFAGVLTLLQHDRHRGRGVRSPGRVWGTPK